MDNTDISIINQVFRSKSWLIVTEDVSIQPELPIGKGSIKIPTAKGDVFIDVYISEDFPLGKIEFMCTNLRGYSHLMASGLLCLAAAPAATIEDRLLLELAKLEKWIEDYYLNEKNDEHFEYYNFPSLDMITVVFEEDSNKQPLEANHGKFNYGLLRNLDLGENKRKSWIAFNLGGRKCRWSSKFLMLFTQRYAGLWIYVKNPPLLERRQTISKWEDLLKLMSAEQTKFLNDEYKKIRSASAFKGGFLLMLGYDIPSHHSNKEIHWETIFVLFEDFPFTSQKIGKGEYLPKDLGKDVLWCKSHNASYERMFGRGQLNRLLTEEKILIIGTGAVGSNLLEALVRGGCRYVDIRDGENIEPGNNCRGQFAFKDSFSQKVVELFTSSIHISPYIESNYGINVQPMRKENPKYADLKKTLSSYHFIFDCSTDKYVSIMLDEMNLPGTIINMSITDEAKQFCVITGIGNIYKIKNDLYNRISPGKQQKFYVATGCWGATFKASFVDINGLLMYALREINRRLEANLSINSFYIDTVERSNGIAYELSYHV